MEEDAIANMMMIRLEDETDEIKARELAANVLKERSGSIERKSCRDGGTAEG